MAKGDAFDLESATAEDIKQRRKLIDRARSIAGEMADLDDVEQGRMDEALRISEQLLRDIITSEAQIDGEGKRQAELRGRLKKLKAEQRKLEGESDSLTESSTGLEEALSTIADRRDEQAKMVGDLRVEVAHAEDEAEALQKEQNNLEGKKQKLTDDIRRLKKLRKEYESAIMKLREERDGLVSDVSG